MLHWARLESAKYRSGRAVADTLLHLGIEVGAAIPHNATECVVLISVAVTVKDKTVGRRAVFTNGI